VTIQTKLRELRARLLEIRDLGWAGAVLSWDQATYMPPALSIRAFG
jgi:carboxypeptidase Taq